MGLLGRAKRWAVRKDLGQAREKYGGDVTRDEYARAQEEAGKREAKTAYIQEQRAQRVVEAKAKAQAESLGRITRAKQEAMRGPMISRESIRGGARRAVRGPGGQRGGDIGSVLLGSGGGSPAGFSKATSDIFGGKSAPAFGAKPKKKKKGKTITFRIS